MSYQVKVLPAAQAQLDKLRERDYALVAEAISSLEQEPRPRNVKKLVQSGLWRLRVGRHRVIYGINDNEHAVIVVRVAKRDEDTYKRL